MSRLLQLGDEDSPSLSLRQELMSMEKHEVVALLEQATAEEANAKALYRRLLQRVATSEAVGKELEKRWDANLTHLECAIWEQATGGNETAIHVLTAFLSNSVGSLLGHSGKARTVMAKFYTDALTAAFESMAVNPERAERGGVEDGIAVQYYVLCQLANVVPKGLRTSSWYELGRTLYTPDV